MKVLPIRALLSQISEHGFHFALSVQISGAAGGGDAIREHGLGFGMRSARESVWAAMK
jgi:hypothetical protein